MKLTLTVLAVTGVVAAADFASNSSTPYASNSSTPYASNSSLPYASNSSPPSATASGASPIPTSISPGCSTFLTALNTAPTIQSCVSPLLTALKSSDKPSVSSVCTAASSSGCSDTVLRSWITSFKGNCTEELVTSPNKAVVSLYEVLYLFKPFTGAVCAKDENQKYCLSSAKGAPGMANAAQAPLTNSDGTPNADAFTNANILWLGNNPNMNGAALCTTCTKNILTSYIQWESSTPLANGLSSSPLLSSQNALWAAVQKECPADFISGTLSNAGASPGAANSASTSSPVQGALVMLALVATGIMTL